MLTIDQALKEIFTRIQPLKPVSCPISKALGSVLAEDVIAKEPVPPFTNSAMDGYALRVEDCLSENAILEVLEDLPAGALPQHTLQPKTAIRIMTGAPIPPGTNAIIPVEQTEKLSEKLVQIKTQAKKNLHIRFKGEEIQPGDKVLKKQTILKPAHLGLLASLGHTQIQVIPKPTVSVITTGSEVIDPAKSPKPGQIRNSNQIAIAANIMALGATVQKKCHVADDPKTLSQVLKKNQSDVILTCGGVSVGEYDFVKPVLSKLGEIFFWKVAIKPGKPFVFGRIGKSWLFGLPGNPVSALIAFDILVRPALRVLAGYPQESRNQKKAKLIKPIAHKVGRREFVRAYLSKKDGEWVVEPLPWQGSAMLRSLTESNAFIVIPEQSPGYSSDSMVEVLT